MKRYSWLLAVVAVLLFGCGDDSKPDQTAQEVEPEWKSWPKVLQPALYSYLDLYGEEPIPYKRDMLESITVFFITQTIYLLTIFPKPKSGSVKCIRGKPLSKFVFWALPVIVSMILMQTDTRNVKKFGV